MRIAIKGIVYDSELLPIVVEFSEEEKRMFSGMSKYVSAPSGTSEDELNELMDMDFSELAVERFGPKYKGEDLRRLQESLCGPPGPEGGVIKCEHKNVETWNHGYHNRCKDCGEKDV